MAVMLLSAVAGAAAAPPRTASLMTVGQQSGHIKATWTLPPNVESFAIEIANQPETGSDGGFFRENVVDVDLLQPTQTSYLSTGQFSSGMYYVHIETQDEDCSYSENNTCFAWSAALPLTIPSRRPTIRAGLFADLYLTSVRVCDDDPGKMLVQVKQVRVADGRTTRRTLSRRVDSPAIGGWDCMEYLLRDRQPTSWVFGRFTYTYRVRDARGIWSKPYVFRFLRVAD